jgi:hypothetical protein
MGRIANGCRGGWCRNDWPWLLLTIVVQARGADIGARASRAHRYLLLACPIRTLRVLKWIAVTSTASGSSHSAYRHHRLHDARHFYAVRAVRAGTPYELVARQLATPTCRWSHHLRPLRASQRRARSLGAHRLDSGRRAGGRAHPECRVAREKPPRARTNRRAIGYLCGYHPSKRLEPTTRK